MKRTVQACLILLLFASILHGEVREARAENPDAQAASASRPAPFQHPGLLHTRQDLQRMRQMVAAGVEPWKSGFEKLRSHSQSRADYRLRGPAEIVHRPGPGSSELASDANAAYQNALMYWITGDDAHAKKAVEILDAWSGKLKTVAGHDAQLAAGLSGFKLVGAAELIRSSAAGWPPQEIERAKTMFHRALYPTIRDFAIFANGNWDGACMKTVLAIGVFCDDRETFDRAIDYYQRGSGNGAITHYIINDAGQCQESGRDQSHTQLGLGQLAECCEVAWSQGIDIYAAGDNRLLSGFEYTARYNLGHDVPFVPHVDTTGKYRQTAISPEGRGRLRPIWEMVWNHYHQRMGLEMPYTQQVVEQLRPEGAAFQADHAGFGTLLFAARKFEESPAR